MAQPISTGRAAVAGILLAVSLSAGVSIAAAPSARSVYYGDTRPDISGFWEADKPPGTWVWLVDGRPLQRDPELAYVGIPYTPAWDAAYQKRRASNLAGKGYGEPHFDCWPRGLMHGYIGGNATMTLTQTPGRVQQIFEEDSQVRDLFTDGRAMPKAANPDDEAYAPRVNGYSVGRWEGGTLVVVTEGTRRETTLGFLAPHSERMRMTERFHRLDRTHLAIDVRIDDAKALAKPMEMKLRYRLNPTGQFEDQFCSENNRNSTDADGFLTIVTTVKRPFGWDLPE